VAPAAAAATTVPSPSDGRSDQRILPWFSLIEASILAALGLERPCYYYLRTSP
jgi:hypothetical protein